MAYDLIVFFKSDVGTEQIKLFFMTVSLNVSSPDWKKAIYPLLGKIELAIFPGVFNTAHSRVKYRSPVFNRYGYTGSG